MSRAQPSARSRLLEMILWMVVGAFGVFFLIPAVSHLLEARAQEADENLKTDSSRAQTEKSQQELDWMARDPLTDQRLLDTPDPNSRTEQ
ncbi:MAG: hypothetical protein QGH51_05820 [Planctomycetota bacterium]|nr:hypothetical protein [Planctomycetota bacterium]MDP6941527.1 hypothetical protein [Planctomycetota bacterium]